MKKILLFGLGFFLLTNAYAQGSNRSFSVPTNTKEIIKQNQIVKEEIYSYTFNKKGIKDSTLNETYYYDAMGETIENRTPAKKNYYRETNRKFANTYDSLGKLLRQVESIQDSKSISIKEYDYDSLGHEIYKYDYNEDTTRLTIEQKIYNDDYEVIALQTKINNFNFYVSRRYYYNSDKDLVKTEAFDGKGEVIYVYSYEYDKALNKKAVYFENAEGKRLEAEYFYNDDQQCVLKKSTVKDLTFMTRIHSEYDISKLVMENSYHLDKTLYETTFYLDGEKVQLNRHYYFRQ